ncbi:MAG: hypothetical protein GY752_05605 [bacterium]|nr:hypothetical protein [bacterium]MCP4801003.1 hypothetical protein [bacterium]
MKKVLLALSLVTLFLFVGCGGDDTPTTPAVEDFVGSGTLSGLAFICPDSGSLDFIIALPPHATGTISISEDYSFTWSTTLIDDDEGTFSECLGVDIAMFTFSGSGTVTHNGNNLTFDFGDGNVWTYEWTVDNEGTLILEDEDSYFEFD